MAEGSQKCRDAHQHGEAARRGDEQGLERRAATLVLRCVLADEQVGEDGRRLPEHEEHVDVIADDQPEHGAGEGEEHAAEAAETVFATAEVAGAIEHDERSDARDDERHRERQGVETEGQREVELRHPGVDLCGSLASRHGRDLEEQPHEDGRWNEGGEGEHARAEAGRERGENEPGEGEADERDDHFGSLR